MYIALPFGVIIATQDTVTFAVPTAAAVQVLQDRNEELNKRIETLISETSAYRQEIATQAAAAGSFEAKYNVLQQQYNNLQLQYRDLALDKERLSEIQSRLEQELRDLRQANAVPDPYDDPNQVIKGGLIGGLFPGKDGPKSTSDPQAKIHNSAYDPISEIRTRSERLASVLTQPWDIEEIGGDNISETNPTGL